MVRSITIFACMALAGAARVGAAGDQNEKTYHTGAVLDDPVAHIKAIKLEADARARQRALRKVTRRRDLPVEAAAPLADFLLNDADGDVRRAAAGALGRMGFASMGDVGTEALKTCLSTDKHAPARRDCAFNFGRMGEYTGSLEELDAGMRDENAEVRRESVVSIGKIAFKSGNDAVSDAVPIIAKLLKKDEDVNVRREAAVALGVVGSPYTANYLSYLIDAAQSDPAKSVRRECVKAMIYLHGDKAAIHKAAVTLKHVAENDEEEEVRSPARGILKNVPRFSAIKEK